MEELEIILSPFTEYYNCFDYISWFHIEEFVRTKLGGFQVKNRWMQRHYVGENKKSPQTKNKQTKQIQ